MKYEKIPPEWSNKGTEPPKEIKKNGFQAGYKPPANFFNWFFNSTTECLKELQDNSTNIINMSKNIPISERKEGFFYLKIIEEKEIN